MIALEERHPDRRIVVCILTVLSVGILFSIYTVLPIWATPPTVHASPYLKARIGDAWHGWPSIQQMIVLGDSWSSTGFEIDGARPSFDNPFGNPAYPGLTVTNGANWIDYLTYERNESSIFTLDFAVGGATVDTKLIKPGVPEAALRSLKTQVAEFEQYNWTWTADTSLFVVWVGVNDITAYTAETRGNFAAEFVVFADLMDQLYVLGARNFLILNAPPLDRAPIMKFSGSEEWTVVTDEWNVNITALVNNFTAAYTETTTLFFDAWKFYDDVMTEPCIFEESCGFEVVDGACEGYYFGAPTLTYKAPNCPWSVDKYLWINALHPSTRMHNTTARVVYDAFMGLG